MSKKLVNKHTSAARASRAAAEMLRELKRYREREPLVQAVIAAGLAWIDEGTTSLRIPGRLHDTLVALASAYDPENPEGEVKP